MNDSVREELQDKITFVPRKITIELEDDVPEMPYQAASEVTAYSEPERRADAASVPAPLPPPVVQTRPGRERGGMTEEIRAARRTSPILVEFQSRNSAIPEWRLQMQNAVRQRREASSGTLPPPAIERPVLLKVDQTAVAAAPQTVFLGEAMPVPPVPASPPVLDGVRRRLEESRKRFSVHEGGAPKAAKAEVKKGVRTFPIAVQPEAAESATEPVTRAEPVSVEERLSAIEQTGLPLFDRKLDTNKLPAIPRPESVAEEAALEEAVSSGSDGATQELTTVRSHRSVGMIDDLADGFDIMEAELVIDDEDLEPAPHSAVPDMWSDDRLAPRPAEDLEEEPFEGSGDADDETEVDFEYYDEEYADEDEDEGGYEEEIEDLAPITMRFNAGMFDLLVGAFSSLLLLSPFIASGGKWLTSTGILAFGVTLAIVMFVYMTASVGFTGRTLGMRIFCLEMIDVEENDYPSFHQAAVSSSLYLVSLALGGVGFATALLNPERRAIHDLLSGTIIVREY